MKGSDRNRQVFAAMACAIATISLVYLAIAALLTGVAVNNNLANHVMAMHNVAAAVIGNPHRFRLITSPYYVQGRV